MPRSTRPLPITLFLSCLALSPPPCVAGGPWKTAGGFSFDWPNVEVSVQRLSDTVYFLHGSGGNMVLSAGEDGLLLVDNEFPQIHDTIMSAIHEIQDGPVDFVLNTHFHHDHAGGNEALALQGAVVVAQENSRERMLREQVNLFFGRVTPAAPAAALPVVTFPSSVSLHFNGEVIESFYVSAAHTDGDAIVYFTDSNVVHMGDVYINGLYPIIDLAGGGALAGYLPALDTVLARIDNETRVVPGHGPVGDRQSLRAYRDMISGIGDRVTAMIAAGEDLEAVLAANPSRDYDADWASDRVGPDDVVKMFYQSITGEFATELE